MSPAKLSMCFFWFGFFLFFLSLVQARKIICLQYACNLNNSLNNVLFFGACDVSRYVQVPE